jgi:N-acetylglucosaminyldiphosphoundecaprenol N-acetyl-beta-D-mannosaminyltransferase
VTGLIGYTLNQDPLEVLLDRALSIAHARHVRCDVFCANPHSLAVARDDNLFKQALISTSFLVADGIGVYLANKIVVKTIAPRITGSDFFYGLNALLNTKGIEQFGRKPRVLFFGSSQQVLDLIKLRFEKDYPQIQLCGLISPPYGEWPSDVNDRLIEQINNFDPDVLWVGMTAPRQEKWIYVNSNRLNVKVTGAIGAVFDFYAGTYPRAPEWVVLLGLEWLVRLTKEPKRMWRRTFISGPVFIWSVLAYHVLNLR